MISLGIEYSYHLKTVLEIIKTATSYWRCDAGGGVSLWLWRSIATPLPSVPSPSRCTFRFLSARSIRSYYLSQVKWTLSSSTSRRRGIHPIPSSRSSTLLAANRNCVTGASFNWFQKSFDRKKIGQSSIYPRWLQRCVAISWSTVGSHLPDLTDRRADKCFTGWYLVWLLGWSVNKIPLFITKLFVVLAGIFNLLNKKHKAAQACK